MSVKFIKGDLIAMAKNGDFDVIVHGCNCFHTMGAGIAGQIAKNFPWAYDTDKSQTESGDASKIGSYSFGYNPEEKLIILNAYTQYHPGPHFNIDAFRVILWKIAQFQSPIRIGFPLIGAGIGAGDKIQIMHSFREFGEKTDCEWTVVLYE